MIQTCPPPRVTRPSQTGAIRDIRSQRTQAEAVLQSLLEARSECEQHLDQFKRSDLYKRVTGRSGFDSAISSTRRMIEQIDRCLAAAAAEVEIKTTGVSRRAASQPA